MRALKLAVVAVIAATVSLTVLFAILLIGWGGFFGALPNLGSTPAFAYWFVLLATPLVLATALTSIAPAVAYKQKNPP